MLLLLPQEQHCHTNTIATAQTPAEGARGEPQPQRLAPPFPRAQRWAMEKEAIELNPALIHGLKFIHTDVFPLKRLSRRSFLIPKTIPQAICLHTEYFPSVVPVSVPCSRLTKTSPKLFAPRERGFVCSKLSRN